MIGVRVCCENDYVRSIFPGFFRVNLLVVNGQYREAESPLSTVAAIPRSELTLPAHQRGRRIGESNSDSRRKEFYDRRRETESSRDHDRSKDYGKDKERDRHKGTVRDPRSSGRDPTPDRRSHSREKVDDHKKRAGIRGTRRTVKTQGKGAATSLLIQRGIDQVIDCDYAQVDYDYTHVWCAGG